MKTSKHFCLFLIILSFFIGNTSLQAQCDRMADSLAMVALYNATDGANWTNTWDLNTPMDGWYGVRLNGSGCVQRISIGSNNLTGSLPSEFGNLTNLKEFRGANNNLSGELPSSIGNLSNLNTFWIGQNNFSGAFPIALGMLSQLHTLNLSSNEFSGAIPSIIGNLTQITHLYIGGNNFNGAIPDEITNLKQLTFLQIYDNQLTGEIPSGLAEIPTLQFIRLYNNNLTGAIPFSFSTMSSLKDLNLANNQLSGYIPDLSNNTQLINLSLHNNKFTFSSLSPNHQINKELINQNKIYYYYEYEISPQQNVWTDTTINRVLGEDLILDLGIDENEANNEYRWTKNGITIATIIGDSKFIINDLSANDFGNYDCFITNPNVPELTLHSGNITLNNITCRERDSLALVDLYMATDGANWTNTWDLNQPISTWYGVTIGAEGCVTSLDLDGNLSCTECIGSGNNLKGALPEGFWRLTALENLSLGQNEQLSGELSAKIGDLAQLEILRLTANFSGAIPTTLTQLTNLIHLDLSYNQLTGTIPDLGVLSNLTTAIFTSNQLDGIVPDFSTNNSVLTHLELIENKLTFSDLIPYLATNQTLTSNNVLYSPQSKLTDDIILNKDVEDELVLETGLDHFSNTYTWYKNGAVYSTTPNNSLTLSNLTLGDIADYWCEVTNHNAPNVILITGIYSLNVIEPICKERDSTALIALYKATDGANWTNTWDTLQPMSTWYGVTVNGNGCVTQLDLDGNVNCVPCSGNGNNLIGTIPDTLWSVNRLVDLSLSNNYELSGPLSPLVGNLLNLKRLTAINSDLAGELPTALGNLSQLTDLELYNNNFSGEIPSSLNQLNHLETLLLGDNNLSGGIPDFSNLTALRTLFLNNNQLTGQIPNSLASLNNLVQLLLSDNQLTGEIPHVLSNLSELQVLYLSKNQLYGSIPKSLSELDRLEYLDLAANNLTGTIPVEFSNGHQYKDLVLSQNKLTGSIPESFDTLNIKALFIDGNELSGDITNRLAALENVKALWLQENKMTGIIPDFSLKNPDLEQVIFYNNDFTFAHILPNLSSNISLVNSNNGDFRYSPQNKIYKDTTIQKDIGENLIIDLGIDEGLASNVYVWYRNGNYLSTMNGDNQLVLNNLEYLDGGIYHCAVTNPDAPNLILESHPIKLNIIDPNCRTTDSLALVALYNATDGANWTNTWDLSTPISSWYGVSLDLNGCVDGIDLDGYIRYDCGSCENNGNNLNGTIPTELSNLTALTFLSLARNNFSGGIPFEIGNCLNLVDLNLSACNFSGNIPSSFNNLFNLESLLLSDNELTGNIPDLNNLTNLQHLYCYNNQLTGSIPNWLGDLTNLERIQLRGNNLTGTIPYGLDNLTKLWDLDFRYNNLSGQLPDYLGNMTNLEFLSLDGNNLEGPIPPAIANLRGNIGLPNNNFAGELPNSFVNHKSSALHLSYNNLEGNISDILNGVESMFRLKLEGNSFSGVVPDLSVKNPNLRGLYLQSNQFTFEHLLPNHVVNKAYININGDYGDGYYISPQQKVFRDTTIRKAIGEDVTIDLLIDNNVTTNVYKWYKDGQLLTTITGNNKLTINSIGNNDFDTYTCEITNPNIPELTLESYNIILHDASLPLFNDLCSNAITITCGETIIGSTVNATYDAELDNCFSENQPYSFNQNGVWYKIEGNNEVIKVSTCGSYSFTYLSIFEGDCNGLNCLVKKGTCKDEFAKAESNFYGELGKTYYIVVYKDYASEFELEISCSDRPTNDLCSGAQPITCNQTIIDSTTYATSDLVSDCHPYQRNGVGLWYKIVGNGQVIYIDACETEVDLGLMIYEGDCNELVCLKGSSRNCGYFQQGSAGSHTAFSSENGKEYYINVSSEENLGKFSLSISCNSSPTNNRCETPTTLYCGMMLSSSNKFVEITEYPTDCTNYSSAYLGLWYEITGNDEIINLEVISQKSNWVIKAYQNDCQNLTCLNESYNSIYNSGITKYNFWGVQGIVYKIFIASQQRADFTLIVKCAPQAANDICTTATLIDCTSTFIDSTTFATSDFNLTCNDYSFTGKNGIWYKIIGNGEIVSVKTNNLDISTTLTLFDGDCNNLNCLAQGFQIFQDFSDVGDQLTFHAENGKDYFLFVESKMGVGEFGISVGCSPPLSNDNISGALAVVCNQSIIGNNEFALDDGAFQNCQNPYYSTLRSGLWYKYKGNDESVTLNTCGTEDIELMDISVFKGEENNLTCVNYGSSFEDERRMHCSNGNPNSQPHVTFFGKKDTTYYFLVRLSRPYGTLGDFILNIEQENCDCNNYHDTIAVDAPPVNPEIIHTHGSITSKVELSNAMDFTLTAGNTVTLLSGFHAQSGSKFTAKIAPCETELVNEPIAQARTKPTIPTKNTNLKVFPNPFKNQTTIQYQLSKNQAINLSIYSITGELIQQLAQSTQQSKGQYTYEFDSQNLKAGMYLVLLQTEEKLISQKIILLE